jgi:hypothetical protein
MAKRQRTLLEGHTNADKNHKVEGVMVLVGVVVDMVVLKPPLQLEFFCGLLLLPAVSSVLKTLAGLCCLQAG